jgi:hypothetical protein
MSTADWKQGDPAEEKGQRSRVFRQTVEIEIVWLAEGDDNGFRDWEAEVRGAVMSAEPPAYPGRGWVSDVEELAAEHACPAAHDSEEDSR